MIEERFHNYILPLIYPVAPSGVLVSVHTALSPTSSHLVWLASRPNPPVATSSGVCLYKNYGRWTRRRQGGNPGQSHEIQFSLIISVETHIRYFFPMFGYQEVNVVRCAMRTIIVPHRKTVCGVHCELSHMCPSDRMTEMCGSVNSLLPRTGRRGFRVDVERADMGERPLKAGNSLDGRDLDLYISEHNSIHVMSHCTRRILNTQVESRGFYGPGTDEA